ncbi:MAG: transposase [Proteobacteria bacterium]|nr:transposase [Pseudomonadota bacterium]
MIDPKIKFKPYNPMQGSFLPPNPKDWLPKDHFCYFLSTLLNKLYEKGHLKPFYDRFKNRKTPSRAAHDPLMMLGVLCYSYINGIFSSRDIEKQLRKSIPLMFLCGGNFPSFRTICRFRKDHLKDFNDLFITVIQYAADIYDLGLNRMGTDRIKRKTGASKLKHRKNNEEQKIKEFTHNAIQKANKIDASEDKRYGYKKQKPDEEPVQLWIKANI